MNQNNSSSAARLMETLGNIFYLMVGLTLLPFVWVYLNLATISPNIIFSVPASRPYLHGIILLTALALVIKALVQYRRRFSGHEVFPGTANIQDLVYAKVKVFRAESLRMYLLLTVSALLVVTGFFLSAEPKYAAAYSVLLIIVSLYRPTPERLFKDMKMKNEEQEYFYNEVRLHREGEGNK